MISRATVYNTLNLFLEKGLLQQIPIGGESAIYDPDLSPQHHLLDEERGVVHDIPWEVLNILHIESVEGFDVTNFQVIMRG